MRQVYKIYNEVDVRNAPLSVYTPQYITFAQGGCKCILEVIPDWSVEPTRLIGNINFFALTDGWQAFAPKGYKMNVFSYGVGVELTKDFIIGTFAKMLSDSGFTAPAIQESLF